MKDIKEKLLKINDDIFAIEKELPKEISIERAGLFQARAKINTVLQCIKDQEKRRARDSAKPRGMSR
jgi:hypothetical protein